MEFKLLAAPTLALKPQTQWIWHSEKAAAFIVGDERTAFALPTSDPGSPTPLGAAPHPHACNLPMTAPLLDEFTAESWRGFRFLPCADYARAVDDGGRPVGDILRTLVFAPDYGTYVLHPPSGAILSLRGGSMALLRRSSDAFESLDKTKTRGRAVLAYAAHPTESLIVYGDNFGAFHAHRFDLAAGKFGKAARIVDKERKASRVELVGTGADGALLAIGGMGYLATLAYAGGKFSLIHEIAIPVRDFISLAGGQVVLVNQGLHGVAAYRYDADAGFAKLGATTLPAGGAVQQMAASKCARYLAVTIQDSPTVNVFGMR